MPADAAEGSVMHIILEVTDSGTPSLTRYARVVVNVTSRLMSQRVADAEMKRFNLILQQCSGQATS